MSTDLAALLAAATPGPWVITANGIDGGDYDTVIGHGPVQCGSYCYGGTSSIDGDRLDADAALIVALRNNAARLVAALAVAEAVVEADDDPLALDLSEAGWQAVAAFRVAK